MPLASVLPAVEIERIFRRHDALFGDTDNSVYNTAIVLWAFLSQVLADDKLRSCAAAVARVGDFLILAGNCMVIGGNAGSPRPDRTPRVETRSPPLSVDARTSTKTQNSLGTRNSML